LNQLAIVLGIFSAQVAGLTTTGMKGDKPGGWRYVVLISGVVAVMQLVVGQVRIRNELMQKREAASKQMEDVTMQEEPDEAQYAARTPRANPQDEECR
jgi:SP family facilitated glucose transporter-like MFS transporter 3